MENNRHKFRIVVTDLQKGETCMDVMTNAAIVTVTSAFNNIKNEDEEGCSHGAQFFECKAVDIMRCIIITLKGISKLVAKHRELGSLLELFLMSMSKEEEDKNE